MVLPDGTNRIRQFRIPRFLPVFLVFLFLFGSASLAWMVRDYRDLKIRMPELARLKAETERQKKQTLYLVNRIRRMGRKMVELNEFDRKLRTMVNLETGEDEGRFQGVGGSEPALRDPSRSMVRHHDELIRAMHRSLDNLDHEIALGKEEKAGLYKFLENQKILLASTPSIWPTKGWMSSRFGYRISPFTGQREFHKGIDIATRMGAPIVAPADGVVACFSRDPGYGRILTIRHGYGVVTRYAHLKKILVKKGQYVKRGETIALVGNSGRSTGPHLHYEVHLNHVAVNPLRYILN